MNQYQQLSDFSLPPEYRKNRPGLIWLVWIIFGDTLASSWLPGLAWRRILLRMFGARIGRGVTFKPGLKVKFPWKLVIGNFSWIGENVWIDNLDWVDIGSNVCISQGCYLCTGNHDYKIVSFPYRLGRIDIEDEVWICAMVKIAPSVRIGRAAVVELGSIVYKSISAYTVASGFPASRIRSR